MHTHYTLKDNAPNLHSVFVWWWYIGWCGAITAMWCMAVSRM